MVGDCELAGNERCEVTTVPFVMDSALIGLSPACLLPLHLRKMPTYGSFTAAVIDNALGMGGSHVGGIKFCGEAGVIQSRLT